MPPLRPEDVPHLIEALERFHKRIKTGVFISSTDKDKNAFALKAVQAYLHSLTRPKLARALNKVLQVLPREYVEKIKNQMHDEIIELLQSSDHSDMKILSSLLDQNATAKILSQDLFRSYSAMLNIALINSHTANSVKEIDSNDQLVNIKFSIQILQLFQEDVRSLYSHGIGETAHSDDLQLWNSIITELFALFFQDLDKDLLMLLGTSLSMVFNLVFLPETICTVCTDVFSILSQDTTCFMFGSTCVDASAWVNSCKDTSVHYIVFIKGLLVCCDKSLIMGGDPSLFVTLLPHILGLCQGPSTNHYLAFHLLSLWYKKLNENQNGPLSSKSLEFIAEKITQGKTQVSTAVLTKPWLLQTTDSKCLASAHENMPQKLERSHYSFMSQECPILLTTLSCIWLNWDSPVTGVSECVADIFRCMLIVCYKCSRERREREFHLCKILMGKVLNMSWCSRTRYQPLIMLLPYVDLTQFFEETPQIKEDMLKCMTRNNLAAIGCDVYTSFLQLIVSVRENSLDVWRNTWMPTLIKGLTTSNRYQRSKVCIYWLPPTLRLIRDSETVLRCSLESRLECEDAGYQEGLLFGWVAVCCRAREILHSAGLPEREDLLEHALFCVHEDIRSEALSLLCCTVKRAEPVSLLEIKLLKEFMSVNLKTDSTPFRHNMTSALRKMTVRIRDSCLSAIKSNTMDASYLACGLEFVDWLYGWFLLNLTPGYSYQRRKTSLDMLLCLLETLVYQDHNISKKGKAPESSPVLVEYARSQNLWDFFNPESWRTILTCLEDGAEEIQTLAFQLLEKYFVHVTLTQFSDLTVVEHVLKRALILLSCPRGYENHSGLLLMSLILQRCVLEKGLTVLPSPSSADMQICFVLERDRAKQARDPEQVYIETLIKWVQTCVTHVRGDLALHYKIYPIHGLSQCITKGVQDIAEKRKILDQKWTVLLEQIIEISQSIIDLMLNVLSGGYSATGFKENCPSFADMGVALESLVANDEHQIETVAITPEFQLLLSWCWINLKESCTCLGGITRAALLNAQSLLSEDKMLIIGETFVKVLITCRHRGGIEGCRKGFSQFCLSLLASPSSKMRDIPRNILHKLLRCLSEDSLSSSITRRSAGLPIIVQTVLQAAYRCGYADIVQLAMDELYNIASRPVPTHYSQHTDLCQSHAFNILKVIFGDANLASLLTAALSRVMVLVLQGFDSPSWAIRNSAMQLIGTLVDRIFSQINQQNQSSNLTLAEFASLYPTLLQYICENIKSFDSTSVTVKPSLYVILTLVSSLGMSPYNEQDLSCGSFLQSCILRFVSSPVFSLRKLSALAYVALSPMDKPRHTLTLIFECIQQRKMSANELHGWLLIWLSVMSSGIIGECEAESIVEFFVKNEWILCGSSCPMIDSLAVQILRLALELAPPVGTVFNELWLKIKSFINSSCEPKPLLEVGCDQFVRESIKTFISLSRKNADPASRMKKQLQEFFLEGLESEDSVRESILHCLKENQDIAEDAEIQRSLWSHVLTEKSMPNFVNSSELLLEQRLRGTLSLPVSDFGMFHKGTLTSRWRHRQGIQAAIFSLEGLMWGSLHVNALKERCELVREWCRQLFHFTNPLENENHRLLAAQSLHIAGGNVLQFCGQHQDISCVADMVTCIVLSSLQLLEDSESDVRQEVSIFLSRLHVPATYQDSLCYSILCDVVLQHLSWCDELITGLLEHLYVPGQLTNAITAALDASSHTLFEPEMKSPTAESCIKPIWVYKTFQKLLISGKGQLLARQLISASQTFVKELTIQTPALVENLKGRPIFNLSWDEKVMESLVGLKCLNLLLETAKFVSCADVVKDNASDDLRFSELISSFEKIPFLHPSLRNECINRFSLCFQPRKIAVS